MSIINSTKPEVGSSFWERSLQFINNNPNKTIAAVALSYMVCHLAYAGCLPYLRNALCLIPFAPGDTCVQVRAVYRALGNVYAALCIVGSPRCCEKS